MSFFCKLYSIAEAITPIVPKNAKLVDKDAPAIAVPNLPKYSTNPIVAHGIPNINETIANLDKVTNKLIA